MAHKLAGPFARVVFGLVLVLAAQLLIACSAQTPDGGPPPSEDPFGTGVNFGNALEAPEEGWWGLTLQESYVQAIAEAGFQTVRLPVKWSGHAGEEPPYALDPAFLARVNEVVGWILERDLNVIVDLHHYDEMADDPAAHVERWLAIWRQIAEHYQDAPDSVAFELMNEPNSALGDGLWNQMVGQALAVVRETNPTRWVVVGPTSWNAIGALPGLEWPADDRLVLTVHFYEPFEFTHQGAEWADPPIPLGRDWTGSLLTPRAGWADWSWGTTRNYGSELTITFDGAWTGFYLQSSQPATGYEDLALRTSRDLDLLITCGDEDGGVPVRTTGGALLSLPLAACGGGAGSGGVTRVIVQNGTDQPQDPFVLERLELVGPDGALPLLVSETEAIGAAFDLVRDWATTNGNPPVLLGEFGAYGTADMAARVRWTRAVRQAAEERGFGWTYWEFGAGFGVYDPDAEVWRAELLDALLGE